MPKAYSRKACMPKSKNPETYTTDAHNRIALRVIIILGTLESPSKNPETYTTLAVRCFECERWFPEWDPHPHSQPEIPAEAIIATPQMTLKPLPRRLIPAPREVIDAVCDELRAGALSVDDLAEAIKRRSRDWYRDHGYEVPIG
jgi:hypothetical protein